MSDLLAHSKAAIEALSVASETAAANKWLVEFESSSNAWVIADHLLQEDNQSFRFFGARILHSKIRRDFRQLDRQSSTSLMESLVGHIIRLAQKPVLELNICRFLCLAISALALQLNSSGIVSQILQWLNPILSSQPTILLELLLVLPEECYDRNVLVDRDQRDLFAQQLCHSGMEVFGFLSSLRASAPSLAVQLQLLKCLERWIYNVDMPLSYIAVQPIFVYALESVSNQQLNEEAVEVVISLVRKFGYGYGTASETALLIPLVIKYISPLSTTWKLQTEELARTPPCDHDEESFELCRNICRTFAEVAEAYMSHLLAVMSDAVPMDSAEAQQQLKAGVSALFQQLLDCASFPHSSEVSLIPLKFFYDMSGYVLDYRQRCSVDGYQQDDDYGDYNDAPEPIQAEHRETVEGLVEALYTQLLHIALRQTRLPAEVLLGRVAVGDELEAQLKEWADLVCDCCQVVGGETALRCVCSVMQTELAGAQQVVPQSTAAQLEPWGKVEACLSALREVVTHVDRREASMMPPLVSFVCSNAPAIALPPLVRTSVELIGCCDQWLQYHPEQLPGLWAVLVRLMEVPHCSAVACIAMTRILGLSKHVPGLPIFDLHNTLMSMRTNGALTADSDNTLLQGICVALSSRPAELRTGFQTIVQPICASLSTSLQCNPGSANSAAVMADIHRLTTVVQYTSAEGGLTTAHPAIEVFPSLQPLMARAIEVVRSEAVCEKVCRFYKYLVRASSLTRDDSGAKCVHPLGFLIYLESMAGYLTQMFQEKFFACFLYCGSIFFSEFGTIVNSAQRQNQDNSVVDRINTVLFRMLWGFSDMFFVRLQSLSDFEGKPDVVEEFFHMLARVLSHCPQQFVTFSFGDGSGGSQSVEVSPRINSTLQAALAGLRVNHNDAQKGILNFVQKLVSCCRSLLALTAPSARAAQLTEPVLVGRIKVFHGVVAGHMAGPLLNHLFLGLTGGSVELHSLDEDHGSILDVLWSLRQLLESQAFRVS